MTDRERLALTLAAFDDANSRDPHRETVDGESLPRELIYARRMSETLAAFMSDASEALQLAARSQHIERWIIPREDYPMDRAGYKRWRTELGRYHARRASEIMANMGYREAMCQRVADLLQKKQLKRDPEAQALEDVICLVFLRHYLADFARKHPEDKLVTIIRKTWNKMSARGHEAALQLPLPPALGALVQRALTPP